MTTTDPRLVRTIVRRLCAALETPDRRNASRRIDRVMRQALRSEAHLEATFAAVQSLRDFGTINGDEAAYLFNDLLDLRLWARSGDRDPAIGRLVGEFPDHVELVEAALADQDTVYSADFYRSRGEEKLAKLIERDLDRYHKTVAEGQVAIYFPMDEAAAAPEEARSNDSSTVVERIIARAAMEEDRGSVGTWRSLIGAIWQVTPEASVRGVREAREIGAIDFEESVLLIHIVIEFQVMDEARADREYQRLERMRDEVADRLAIDLEHPIEQPPFEYLAADQALRRRWRGIFASVLRHYGEHQIANLLLDDPAEYDRIKSLP
jgi:hypothetical protein